jgi:hypothetical protein
MTPSRRCRPTPHPCAALPHAPPRSLKLRLSFLMLAPVDVTRLSLLPTVSGRGDTIPGGAPSFSLRGNDDPKDGHSFFFGASLLPYSPLLRTSHSSFPLDSPLPLLLFFKLVATGRKPYANWVYWMRQPWLPGRMPSSARTQVQLAGCLNPSSSPQSSVNQSNHLCMNMSLA